MAQDASFPSLNQVLVDRLHGFPRAKLNNEPVDTVRQALWSLVESNSLTPIQFMAVWCEYARAKEVDLNHGEYYFGLEKDSFITISKEDVISVSIQALDNGLQRHLEFIQLWEETRHQVTEQDGNEQEEEEGAGDDSEDEVASVSIRRSPRRRGQRELAGPVAQARSLAPKKRRSTRNRSLSQLQNEDEPAHTPRKRQGRPRKYPLSERPAKKRKSSSAPRKRGHPRKHPLLESPSAKSKSKGNAATAVVVTPPKSRASLLRRMVNTEDEEQGSSRTTRSATAQAQVATPRSRGRPRKRPLSKVQDVDEPPSPRKRGRRRKIPLMDSSTETPKSSSPKETAGRPSRKHSVAESSTAKSKDKDGDAPTTVAAVTPPRTIRARPSQLQVNSDQDSSSQTTRSSNRRIVKPKIRFDPCNGNGRYWSEQGQPIRKIPTHALMMKAMGAKKRPKQIFDIAKRATKAGDYTFKSLWKYICPNDGKSYIVEIANTKGVRAGKIEVTYRGYGRKSHRVLVKQLHVPTDKDFETFEESLLYARQLANERRAGSRRYGAK